MPIDWDKFDKDVDDVLKKAGDKTDAALASKISSITRLTDDEIMEICPTPADVDRLRELMRVVKSAEDRNTKITKLVDNIDNFAGVIVSMLDKLA